MRKTYNPRRLQSLCEEGDYGIFAPPLNAQVALNELCKYFLGDDWYAPSGVSSTEQVNTEIVAAIEQKYRGCRVKRYRRKRRT